MTFDLACNSIILCVLCKISYGSPSSLSGVQCSDWPSPLFEIQQTHGAPRDSTKLHIRAEPTGKIDTLTFIISAFIILLICKCLDFDICLFACLCVMARTFVKTYQR